PALEAVVPSLVGVAGIAAAEQPSAAPVLPKRLAFVYVPNGKNMVDWTPAATGADYQLPMILEPLAKHQNDFTVISGLAHNQANALGDGGGDHARSAATFLTAHHPRKTSGANIESSISIDQLAANK